MNKLVEYGRKAMFYIRVMSGYEQRRIQALRLQMENKKLQLEQAKRDGVVERIPEQFILSQVRRIVEERQNVNKFLNDMDAAFKEYFKPIDKGVESLMSMQMEKEKAMKEILGEAVLERAEKEADKLTGLDDKAKMEMMTAMFKQSLLEHAKAEAAAEMKDSQNQTKESSSSMG